MKRIAVMLIFGCLLLSGCGTGEAVSSAVSGISADPTVSEVSEPVAPDSDVPETTTAATSAAGTTATKTKAPTTTAAKAPSSQKEAKYDRTETVSFADFDSGDDAFSLNTAIETINMKGAVAAAKGEKVQYILKMPKRRYEFGSTIKLNGTEDFVIDGSGSSFIFTENVTAFYLESCKNTILKNFTVDYDPLRYTQGVIKAINGNKVTVEIDEGYPSDVNFINGINQKTQNVYGTGEGTFSANVYDLKTGAIKENSAGNYIFKNDCVSKGGRLVELSLHSNSIWQTPSGGMSVGDGVAFTYTGDKMLWAANCRGGLEFNNITVWGTSGCGFWELDGVGGSHYKNVRVEPGPKPKGATRDRFVSVNGDCLHQNANLNGPIIEDCSFTHMLDDVINIHGLTYYVLSSSGNKLMLAPRWDYPFEVGETIAGYNSKTLANTTGNVKVTAIRSYKDSAKKAQIQELYRYCDKQWGDDTLVYEVTTDKPTGLAYGDYVVSQDRQGSGTVIRNCTFGKNRSRGIVVKGDNVLIENNTIIGTNFPAIKLELDVAFGESDYVSNAVIRGNTIINGAVCMDMNMYDTCNLGAITVGYTFDQAHTGYQQSYEHKNITIENNEIRGTALYGIFCTGVDGLTIRNNKITNPFLHGVGTVGKAYEVTPNAGILIGQCKNVTVTGNTVTGGPAQITQAVQIDKNVSGVKANSNNTKK